MDNGTSQRLLVLPSKSSTHSQNTFRCVGLCVSISCRLCEIHSYFVAILFQSFIIQSHLCSKPPFCILLLKKWRCSSSPQGPCTGNQQSLAHSRLWDAVVGFLHVFAHMQMKLSQVCTALSRHFYLNLKLTILLCIGVVSWLRDSTQNQQSVLIPCCIRRVV